MTRAGRYAEYVPAGIKPGDSIHWSNVSTFDTWRGETQQSFTWIELATFGDYDNSTEIERSNHRVMRAQFPELVHVYGSHGSEGLGFLGALADQSDELREALDALADYPILDESDASELESELEGEAWESYGRDDFVRALAGLLDERDPTREHALALDRALESKDFEHSVFGIWQEGCDAYNVNGGAGHTIEAGGGVYFYVDEWLKEAGRAGRSDWSRGARAALDEKLADLSRRVGVWKPLADRDRDLTFAHGMDLFWGWVRLASRAG